MPSPLCMHAWALDACLVVIITRTDTFVDFTGLDICEVHAVATLHACMHGPWMHA
jgi:hypothetical protein